MLKQSWISKDDKHYIRSLTVDGQMLKLTDPQFVSIGAIE